MKKSPFGPVARPRTNRVAEVNRELKARGEVPRLRRGHGYYYFDGPACAWFSSSVHVYRADDLSVAEWLREYDALKSVNNNR